MGTLGRSTYSGCIIYKYAKFIYIYNYISIYTQLPMHIYIFNRLPYMALYGYVEGTRSRGRQQKTWMDNIREDLQRTEMDMEEVKESIWNRESWRRRVEDSSSALA